VSTGNEAASGPTAPPRIEVGIDCQDLTRLGEFWSEALGYGIGTFHEDETYLELREPPGCLHVYLQKVPEPKTTKNRLHFDLMSRDPDALIDRLIAIGAERLGESITSSEGAWWQVMTDPEGNEFCVCSESANR
jgi:predicted enzyme related to lactoylglutathione lyase